MLGLLLATMLAVGDTTHLVLVATTDVHGRATAWNYETDSQAPLGLTRVATLVDSLRRRYAGQVVVVDAGDLIQGNPFATYFARVAPTDPHPVLDAMNLIGYDAATPGNHEFNFGVDVMRRSLAAASFPYVSANIISIADGRPLMPPFVLLQRGGVRVGITGLTTPGVMVWDGKLVDGRVRVERMVERAKPAIGALAGAGADVIIALVHAGLGARSSYDTTGIGRENSAELLASLPIRPQIVVVGHSHRAMADSVLGGVHFVQPRNWAQAASVTHLSLERDGGRWRVRRVRGELVDLGGVEPSPRLAGRLHEAHEAVRTWAAAPIGEAAPGFDATLARAEDTPIMDFVNAEQRAAAGAQLSATAAFNTAGGFPAGPLRLRDVAALYPYENTLRAVRISGAALHAYLEQSAAYFRSYPADSPPVDPSVPGYNFDIVSGVDYVIDLTQPVGSRIRELHVDGRPVTPSDTFTLALNSYRQAGGGGFTMFDGLPVVYDREENIRDLLVEAIRGRGVLRSQDDFVSNWRIEPAEAAAWVRAYFLRPDREGHR